MLCLGFLVGVIFGVVACLRVKRWYRELAVFMLKRRHGGRRAGMLGRYEWYVKVLDLSPSEQRDCLLQIEQIRRKAGVK